MPKDVDQGSVSLGQVVDSISSYLKQVKNLLGAYMVVIVAIAWVLIALVGSQQPAWLIALIAVPLVVFFCAVVYVLVNRGLTSPNNLLQSEYIKPLEQLEQSDFEAEYARRMGAPDQESVDASE